MINISQTHGVVRITAILLLSAPTAQAVVKTIDATVSAEVKEFIAGQEVNTDLAFEDLVETTGMLPLVVVAQLSRDGQSDGEDVAGAFATTNFYDPRLSTLPDPNEFSLGLAAFSTLTDISYSGKCKSTETREVIFLEEEILESAGTLLQAQSYFFLDGILIIWGEQKNSDLSATQAQVILSVQQERFDSTNEQPASETVLEADLTLSGQSDGTATVSATGVLNVENVTVLDLTDPASEFGPVHVVVIPDIAIPYIYLANVDEQFTLTATIEATVENQPTTGASVELGVPLLELAGIIRDEAGEDFGDRFDEFLADMLPTIPAPPKPLSQASKETIIQVLGKEDNLRDVPLLLPMCGGMSIELGMLLMIFASASTIVFYRRR